MVPISSASSGMRNDCCSMACPPKIHLSETKARDFHTGFPEGYISWFIYGLMLG
jgi:hypothetical protein